MASTSPVRRPLDRASILDTATSLVRDADADALSARKLGQALGTDPTAVYRHFRDMDELAHALLDRVFAELMDAADVSLPWRQRLTSLLEDYVRLSSRYPAIAHTVMDTRPIGPQELCCIEFILQAFAEAGLGDQDQLDYYVLCSSYAIHFAIASMTAVEASDPAPWPERPWIAALPQVPSDKFPRVTAVLPRLLGLRTDAVLRCGLDIILDSAEALGHRRHTMLSG